MRRVWMEVCFLIFISFECSHIASALHLELLFPLNSWPHLVLSFHIHFSLANCNGALLLVYPDPDQPDTVRLKLLRCRLEATWKQIKMSYWNYRIKTMNWTGMSQWIIYSQYIPQNLFKMINLSRCTVFIVINVAIRYGKYAANGWQYKWKRITNR